MIPLRLRNLYNGGSYNPVIRFLRSNIRIHFVLGYFTSSWTKRRLSPYSYLRYVDIYAVRAAVYLIDMRRGIVTRVRRYLTQGQLFLARLHVAAIHSDLFKAQVVNYSKCHSCPVQRAVHLSLNVDIDILTLRHRCFPRSCSALAGITREKMLTGLS